MSPKAKESPHVEKARRKLREQFAIEESRITPAALEKMSSAIKTWISRHSQERINLKSKEFTTLFDKNQHPATVKSKFVSKLLDQLKSTKTKKNSPLEGRITHENQPVHAKH